MRPLVLYLLCAFLIADVSAGRYSFGFNMVHLRKHKYILNSIPTTVAPRLPPRTTRDSRSLSFLLKQPILRYPW
ncbi:hypothetical protein QR680_007392 [Steinernema hermaphroditum]|uniref:Uncharacterized protein n=1 Tax=Steinernema hermaphroditum TaxID=289476 RepID=A0AA39IF87_9BILA|nr:hypothetical protein QR680_007392 [Steinernema hermaphroditum]